MIPRLMVAALCVLGPLTCVAHGGNINGEASYISFSVPGASGTSPTGINNSMEVTGYYFDSPTTAHGFLRKPDGTIITFSVPGAIWTSPQGINAAGDITGYYIPGTEPEWAKGFLRYADGRIETFDADQTNPITLTFPTSINDYDEIAGEYENTRLPSAFTRSRDGVLTSITAPFGGVIGVTAINASGSVVGYSGIAAGTGFVAHPDGFWAEIAVPGNPVCTNQTIPQAINAAGTIAGSWATNYYNDSACEPLNTGGFVMSPDGKLTLFPFPVGPQDYPDPASHGFLAQEHWFSMNQVGDITASYSDAVGYFHGFVRNPYGTITSFDPPESRETFPSSINDAGVIAGSYSYSNFSNPPEGFIRVP